MYRPPTRASTKAGWPLIAVWVAGDSQDSNTTLGGAKICTAASSVRTVIHLSSRPQARCVR